MKKGDFWGKHLWSLLFLAVFLAEVFSAGCGIEKTDSRKVKDLPYTILEKKEVPEEFLEIIEGKKEKIFKLTYADKENLYIAVGYGAQKTGGYSIAVNQCYLTKNAIYFDTTLIGPAKGEKVNEVKTCPYLVIKTEYLEKSVVFE